MQDAKLEQVRRALDDKCRERYEAGDARALADAIAFSNMFHVPLPLWAAQAFNDAHEARKLRNVFGPDPRGRPRDANRDWLMWKVWRLVETSGRAKDDDLFGEIGEKLGLGENAERRVSRLFYEAEGRRKILLSMLNDNCNKSTGNSG